MPLIKISQNNFNQGEIGQYMVGRADLEIFQSSVQRLENFLVLPHGGLQRRRGFEYVDEITEITDSTKASLRVFDFNKEQQYLLVFVDKKIYVYADKLLAATIETPYKEDAVRDIRTAQTGDTLMLAHPDYKPRALRRRGSDTQWTLNPIEFDPLPFFNFNVSQKLKPSTTTGNGTVEIQSEPGYWNGGHFVDEVEIRTNGGKIKLKEPTQDASSGTAQSSAGSASNAFDGNNSTNCDAGTDGWIGYDFGSDKRVKVIAIRANSSSKVTHTLSVEVASQTNYSDAEEIKTGELETDETEWGYINVPYYEKKQYLRIRETGGETLDLNDVVFNFGLKATMSVEDNLDNTDEVADWQEQGWGLHVGYPRTVTFLNNRTVFGGNREEPATIFFSKDGDLFNFDDTDVEDDFGFAVTISSENAQFIRDMKTDRSGLLLFCSDGEFSVTGAQGAVSPTTISIRQQSRYGSSNDTRVVELNGELTYNTSNRKEIRTAVYSFSEDAYVSENKTVFAHQMFQRGKYPTGITKMRAMRDTQAQLLFVTRQDGEMGVLTIDRKRNVQAWSRFTTQGLFRDCQAVETDHGFTEGAIPTLYCIVEREIDGVTKTFIEALTEENVFLDHWYIGDNDTPKTNWGGLTTLPNTLVTVIGDGTVAGNFVVDSNGDFVLDKEYSDIQAGLAYPVVMETHPVTLTGETGVVRGNNIALKRAIVNLFDSLDMRINGRPLRFRQFGPNLLDEPLVSESGQKEVRINNLQGTSRDPFVRVEVLQPVQSTLLTLDTEFIADTR